MPKNIANNPVVAEVLAFRESCGGLSGNWDRKYCF